MQYPISRATFIFKTPYGSVRETFEQVYTGEIARGMFLPQTQAKHRLQELEQLHGKGRVSMKLVRGY